nr:hypothetical protein [Tanacetum cinerariifolium]
MTLEEMIAWEKEESQSPCYLISPPLKPKNSFKEFKRNALLDDFEDVEGEGERLGSSSSNFVQRMSSIDTYSTTKDLIFDEQGKVLLDDFESVGFGKGKVLLDDFEAVGNGKDKVDGDDTKDELISIKGDVTQVFFNLKKWVMLMKSRLGPWVTALEFINDGGEIRGGCFGDIKSYIKKGKLEKVVAIITSCKQNVLGDMNVTLKDPSGIMSGTIHYKVLSSEDGYIKDIKVGYALILCNVYVFCPKSSNYALNITLKNLVKIFKKDTIVEDADGASVKDKVNLIEEVKELGVAA